MFRFIMVCMLWPAAVFSQDLPAWFFQTPQTSETLYAVGYARAYDRIDTAVAMAARDAAHQLSLAVSADVRGERLFQTLPGGQVVYQGEMFQERPLNRITPVYLDTVVADGMVLVLAASHQPETTPDKTLRLPAKNAPNWITTLPETAGGAYALGTARKYFYPEHSWQEAERQARHELAYSFITRQQQVLYQNPSKEYGVTASATSIRLNSAQIMARWMSDTMYFVLIRGKSSFPAPQVFYRLP